MKILKQSKKKINISDIFPLKKLLSGLNLNTICTEALCPNISECFKRKHAAFLILGKICSRNCGFCGMSSGLPEPVDLREPLKIAEAVKRLNLRHVVITSPARDDLPLGGAEMFVRTINILRKNINNITIEILIPDFKGKEIAIKKVAEAGADIIGHNIETVSRLYKIRKGADYKRSLQLLKKIKKFNKEIKTKSAIMLGLGEKETEVEELFYDLLEVGCDYLSIGQYFQPTKAQERVREYINYKKFNEYKKKGLALGFIHIESGQYVRSSYLAERYK